jgi:sugar phosphate isomerase/epimerase
MKIGMMNNPRFNLCAEIAWAKKNGFDYLDLTLEPPASHPRELKVAEVNRALRDYKLAIVGHTAYYLPIASPYETLRKAALEEMRWALQFFAEIGASTVTVHPDKSIAFVFSPKAVLQTNLQSLAEIVTLAEPLGIQILIENMDRTFNTVEQIQEALGRMSQLGFHLDVGHANLNVERNRTGQFLQAFRERLFHVHFSDNFGKSEDLHLPLGAGNIPWPKIIGLLKDSGYDGTITLEIFSADRRYLLFSRDKVRGLWGS